MDLRHNIQVLLVMKCFNFFSAPRNATIAWKLDVLKGNEELFYFPCGMNFCCKYSHFAPRADHALQ